MSRISLHDEAEITWYFLHGARKFERSTHKAMTDRLERDSSGSTACPVCIGAGILEDLDAVARHRARHRPRPDEERRSVLVWKNTGIWCDFRVKRDPAVRKMLEDAGEIQEQPISVSVGAECQVCHGTGAVSSRRKRPRCECWGKGKFARSQCLSCLGTGTPQLDARPVCGSHEDGGVEVDGDTLRRFAAVSRRLNCLSPEHRRTLERYYGVHGQSWADQPGGRILALEASTPAGRRLLRRTRVEGDEATQASDAERIAAQIDLQSRAPETWRHEMLEEAAQQARAVHQAATAAWSASKGTQPWEDALEDVSDDVVATGEAYEAWLDRNWGEDWFDPCSGPEGDDDAE